MKQGHPSTLFEIMGRRGQFRLAGFWNGAGRRCGKPWTARCRRGEDVTVAL